MNKRQIILTVGLAALLGSATLAGASPKKSSNFNANYKSLIQDQKASPQVAACIATSYDLAEKDRKFDRLGFTQDDISKAKTQKIKSSEQKLSINGQARNRKSGQWQDIALHCIIKNGTVKNIDIAKK